jgi:hypothetical protein
MPQQLEKFNLIFFTKKAPKYGALRLNDFTKFIALVLPF